MTREPSIDPALLEPSLSGVAKQIQPIYSPTVLALTAFFGGPLAVIAVTAVNTHRLQRTRRDLPWILALAAATIGLVHLAYGPQAGAAGTLLAKADPRIVMKVFALGIFGLSYWAHRLAHRGMRFSRLKAPSALAVGAVCVLGGIYVQRALVIWAQS